MKTDLSDEGFSKQTTDEEMQDIVSSYRNKNDIKNTKWSLNVYNAWRKHQEMNIIINGL